MRQGTEGWVPSRQDSRYLVKGQRKIRRKTGINKVRKKKKKDILKKGLRWIWNGMRGNALSEDTQKPSLVSRAYFLVLAVRWGVGGVRVYVRRPSTCK